MRPTPALDTRLAARLLRWAAMPVALVLLSASTDVSQVQRGRLMDSATAGRPCFTASEIHNFRSAGDRTLYLRIRVSEVFEIGASPCPGLAFANGLNIRPDGPSDQLCVGDRARIAPTGRGTAPVTCNIRVERKLTREQVSALPDSAQP